MDTETRRKKVYDKLREGSNHKLLYRSTGRALDVINEAYKLTFKKDESSFLPEPFPSLVSYRKALLMLRNNPVNDDDLIEIDELLANAKSEVGLGPWPRLYRLAVLGRLKKIGSVDNIQINPVYKEAINAIQRSITNTSLDIDNYPNVIQTELFNCLELLTLLIDLDYKAIEGIGCRTNHQNDNSEYSELFAGMYSEIRPWSLFGRSEIISSVQYPRELAISELESRAEFLMKEENVLLYVLGENQFQWKFGVKNDWNKLTGEDQHRWLFLLTHYLKNYPNTFEDIRAEVSERLGQNSRRCIKKLNDKLKENYSSIEDSPHLESTLNEITIYGAVDICEYRSNWD